MAYKGYKGCGPRKLGASPMKQKSGIPDGKQKVDISDFAVRQTPRAPNRAEMIKNQSGFYNNEFTQPKPQIGNLNSVIDLSDMLTGGPVGGLVKKAGLGFVAKSGLGKFIKNTAKRVLNPKKAKAHKEALERFAKNTPRKADGTPDYTKTSHSGYTKATGPKPQDESEFLRAGSFGNDTFDARNRKFYGQKPGSN